MSTDTLTHSIGIVGARGYVGRELIALLDQHPTLRLSLAVSTTHTGQSIRDVLDAGPPDLSFTDTDPVSIAHDCPDVLVLAMPNGRTHSFIDTLDRAGAQPKLIIDLSADTRFDDNWIYTIPELHAERLHNARRIANPGCYATAMQLVLAPVLHLTATTPHCFGVSGYSGAGSKPSPRNDTSLLDAGITPYALAGHLHEKEASAHLYRPVRFAPSVAPFFRGIVLTALFDVPDGTTVEQLTDFYNTAYTDSPCIDCIGPEMPRVQDVVNTPSAIIGGITIDPAIPGRAGAVCVIDNLLKGAASQALQNINLALNLSPLLGLAP